MTWTSVGELLQDDDDDDDGTRQQQQKQRQKQFCGFWQMTSQRIGAGNEKEAAAVEF